MEVWRRKQLQRRNHSRAPGRRISGVREGRVRDGPSWPGVPGEKGKRQLAVLGPPAPRRAAPAAGVGLRVAKSIGRGMESAASQAPRGGEARGAGRGPPPVPVCRVRGGTISALPGAPAPAHASASAPPSAGAREAHSPSLGGAGRAPGPLLLPSAPLGSPGRKLAAGKELGAATARGGGGRG